VDSMDTVNTDMDICDVCRKACPVDLPSFCAAGKYREEQMARFACYRSPHRLLYPAWLAFTKTERPADYNAGETLA